MHVFYLFSVMEKLPATSYVRLVDIWLIFGQLMPFIQVSTVCGVFMLLGIKFTKYVRLHWLPSLSYTMRGMILWTIMVFKDKSKMEKRCRQKAKYIVNKKMILIFFSPLRSLRRRLIFTKYQKLSVD